MSNPYNYLAAFPDHLPHRFPGEQGHNAVLKKHEWKCKHRECPAHGSVLDPFAEELDMEADSPVAFRRTSDYYMSLRNVSLRLMRKYLIKR